MSFIVDLYHLGRFSTKLMVPERKKEGLYKYIPEQCCPGEFSFHDHVVASCSERVPAL